MLRVAVDEYMQIVSFLEVLGTDSPWDHLRKAGLNPRVLSSLRAACKKLGLRVTLKHFEDLFDAFEDSEKTAENLRQNASSLAGTLRRELSTKLFLTLPDDASIESFENERPFDTESISVNERFSDAIYDMQEAANCLALGRATACVFHLMRVLEVGLSALANELKIPWPSHNDWQGVINAIEGKIKEIEKGSGTLPKDWREKRQFYADAATQFTHFKDGWRNYAMHFHAVYDEPKAKLIFASVREFMRVLAKRLSSVAVSEAVKI